MTHQAFPLEQIQHPRTPHLTFDKRVGFHILCVLPDTILDNTQLVDPVTGIPQRSLRQECSSQGLCYVRVRKPMTAEGHYWADVWGDSDAATSDPDLASDAYVVLTEEDLTFALPLDERLQKKDAAQIRRLMQAHARELAPLRPRAKPVPAADLPPAPFNQRRADQVDAEQLCPVEVTIDDVPETLRQGGSTGQSANEPLTAGSRSSSRIKAVDPCVFQQVLLRTMRKALQRQLAQTCNQARALELKMHWALVTRVQDWQRRTRQRVVHVEECSWCVVRQCWVWRLLLEIPKSLLAESAAQAAAA